MTRELLHRARLEPWALDELKVHLGTIVDKLADRNTGAVSPLDVLLELLGGELEAFVLFGRAGHLDPPREDGKVPIAILRRRSDDPQIDENIRASVKKWVLDREEVA